MTYIQCNCVVFPEVGFVIHHVIQLFLKEQKLKRLQNSFTNAFRIWIRGRYAFPLSRFVPYVLVLIANASSDELLRVIV